MCRGCRERKQSVALRQYVEMHIAGGVLVSEAEEDSRVLYHDACLACAFLRQLLRGVH